MVNFMNFSAIQRFTNKVALHENREMLNVIQIKLSSGLQATDHSR